MCIRDRYQRRVRETVRHRMGCGNGTEAENFPLEPGCVNFDIALRVPDGETGPVDAFFAEHEQFMRKTHNTKPDGSQEPHTLAYFVTKVKEPVPEGEGTTGNTLYALTETYRTVKGCEAHMEEGQKSTEMFAHFQEVVSKYAVSMMMMAPVVHTHDNKMLHSQELIKQGCKAFTLHFTCPDSEQETVDKFFADHNGFMKKTHRAETGDEPCALYYAVTKKPEQTDPLDPAKGLTGHQQYCLTEVYKGQEGCDAHFKEGMAAEDMFKEFQRVCKEHTKLHIMFADVVHTM
eukprot:TRINITY_DN474_c0_g1_i1.p1 TRINITY_DN474_c0_g1~~TRINITY_DN474_c0_g1_i1.p1  ORF type:complete len:289 (+),score=93.05 TRINITY_DN474_c0_g1_i1:185-1051(+)